MPPTKIIQPRHAIGNWIVHCTTAGLMLISVAASQVQTRDAHPQLKSGKSHSDEAVRGTHLTWSDYAGAADGAQYSALSQINRSNVSQLRVEWSYPTGDGNKYLFNPIVVDRTMYVLAQNNSIVALEATTGHPLWTHLTAAQSQLITNRGINYWESADRSDRRLLFAVDNFLEEIDARTGQVITDFGEHGRVDLREGLGRLSAHST